MISFVIDLFLDCIQSDIFEVVALPLTAVFVLGFIIHILKQFF